MPARPRKGKRFGGSSAHHKAMMANLVASLVAAEAIVTTEAKAKAVRPVAEKLITKAKKGGLHNHRQVLAYLRDPEMTAKLALGGWRIYEVGISYSGRTYAEGKKINWKDGVSAFRCILKYGLWRRIFRRRRRRSLAQAADKK